MTKAVTSVPEGAADQIYDLAKTPGVTGGHHFAELIALVTGESNFKQGAHNNITGAEGPFQFIKGTWLALLRNHGEELGVKSELVAQIKTDKHGHLTVSDPKTLKSLLALRDDLALSTRMAAKYLDDAQGMLHKLLHRQPNKAELQLSFFLGPSGTAKMVKAGEQEPHRSAADIVPHAAHANKNLFYTHDGKARTVSETLAFLASRNQANEQKFAAYVKRALPGMKLDMGA